MPIRVTCPQCQARYQVAEQNAGQTATCAKCQASIFIPAPQAVGVAAGASGRTDRADKVDLRSPEAGVAEVEESAITQITPRLDLPVAAPDRWKRRTARRATPRVEKPRRREDSSLLAKLLVASMALNALLAVCLAAVALRASESSRPSEETRPLALQEADQAARSKTPPPAANVSQPPASRPMETPKLPAPAGPLRLMGSGSSFVNPLMQNWISQYEPRAGVSISYLSTGSGKGVDNLLAGACHFACSDAPLTTAQREAAQAKSGEILHLPLATGAVVAAYNLPGEPALRFTGPLLAEIYLGKVTRWNDPAIRALNPQASLPDQPIVVVYRSDKSGTTYLWTDYLSKVSPAWKDQVGVGTEVKWPIGEGRTQSEGVANYVRRTEGTLGYFELSFALANRLRYASLKNRAGEFVEPSLASTTAAAAGLAHLPEDLCFSLIDTEGREAYPICGAVWAILFVEQPPELHAAVVDFLKWIAHEGQGRTSALNYASLPGPVVEQIDRKLALVKTRRE